MKKKNRILLLGDILGLLAAFIIFIVPFLFMLTNSLKERREANLLSMSLPDVFHWENYKEVFQIDNGIILTAFKNSFVITIGAVIILIITCSMSGYVLQRRKGKGMSIVSSLIMAGLMVPAAILPTIVMLQKLYIYKTTLGIILIEVALQTPFTVMLYRGFMSTVPEELEEAGYIDGCSRWKMFTSIIFPLLKPVTSTVIILNAVTVFNDFTNPLYFYPGNKNATVQTVLYNFMGQFASSYNLLFAGVIIVTIPMLILFIFFNKKIIDEMTAGAVKG